MDSATKGAVNELAVAVDLYGRGFSVFKNMSPTGVSDLIATKTWDEKTLILFIQVKTSSPYLSAFELSHNDVLAIVSSDGRKVEYRTTPGLTHHFEDALSRFGKLNIPDSFAFIKRKTVTTTGPRDLSMWTGYSEDKGFEVWHLGYRGEAPTYTVTLPLVDNSDETSLKISKVARRVLDESNNPDEIREKFNISYILKRYDEIMTEEVFFS